MAMIVAILAVQCISISSIAVNIAMVDNRASRCTLHGEARKSDIKYITDTLQVNMLVAIVVSMAIAKILISAS